MQEYWTVVFFSWHKFKLKYVARVHQSDKLLGTRRTQKKTALFIGNVPLHIWTDSRGMWAHKKEKT